MLSVVEKRGGPRMAKIFEAGFLQEVPACHLQGKQHLS